MAEDVKRCEGCEAPPKVVEVSDPVFRPAHYTQWKMEPFTFLMLNQVPFPEGSAIKYLMRWRKKNGIEDLKKARRIIDMIIELEEHGEDYRPKKGAL
jgi:hypothetical protein